MIAIAAAVYLYRRCQRKNEPERIVSLVPMDTNGESSYYAYSNWEINYDDLKLADIPIGRGSYGNFSSPC
jgi:hypothetical protein